MFPFPEKLLKIQPTPRLEEFVNAVNKARILFHDSESSISYMQVQKNLGKVFPVGRAALLDSTVFPMLVY